MDRSRVKHGQSHLSERVVGEWQVGYYTPLPLSPLIARCFAGGRAAFTTELPNEHRFSYYWLNTMTGEHFWKEDHLPDGWVQELNDRFLNIFSGETYKTSREIPGMEMILSLKAKLTEKKAALATHVEATTKLEHKLNTAHATHLDNLSAAHATHWRLVTATIKELESKLEAVHTEKDMKLEDSSGYKSPTMSSTRLDTINTIGKLKEQLAMRDAKLLETTTSYVQLCLLGDEVVKRTEQALIIMQHEQTIKKTE
jgi:hypothetical protein